MIFRKLWRYTNCRQIHFTEIFISDNHKDSYFGAVHIRTPHTQCSMFMFYVSTHLLCLRSIVKRIWGFNRDFRSYLVFFFLRFLLSWFVTLPFVPIDIDEKDWFCLFGPESMHSESSIDYYMKIEFFFILIWINKRKLKKLKKIFFSRKELGFSIVLKLSTVMKNWIPLTKWSKKCHC